MPQAATASGFLYSLRSLRKSILTDLIYTYGINRHPILRGSKPGYQEPSPKFQSSGEAGPHKKQTN